MRRRAERQDATRRRIVEATVELHRTVGPARTTISAVASKSGVQRHTVYRHFPDEASLLKACSGLFLARHPPPDPKSWTTLSDAGDRLKLALTQPFPARA